MSILAEFRAGGRPRTKGSLKVYCTKGPGHKIHLEEEVAESKIWRKVVARAAREYQTSRYGTFLRHPDPVEVRLVFHFPREQEVRNGAPTGNPIPTHDTPWPTHITLGDVDKLARNVLDALSMPARKAQAPLCSGLILDDSQVVKLLVAKFWASPDVEAGVGVLIMDAEGPETEREALAGSMRVDRGVRA